MDKALVIARASLRSPKQSMRAAALSAASGLLRRSAPRNDAFIARSAFIARRAFIGRLRPFIARSAFILGGLLPAVAFAQDLTVCAGKGYTLTSNVDATGASEVTYEWYESVNGAAASAILNSNTPSISITEGRPEGTYRYARKATNTECPGGVFSNTYTVVVAGAPPVVASVSASTLCAGGSSTLRATVSSGTTSSMTYTWNIGGTESTTSANTITTQELTADAAFTVTVTNANGCTSAESAGTITITSPGSAGQPATCGCVSGRYPVDNTCRNVTNCTVTAECCSGTGKCYGSTVVVGWAWLPHKSNAECEKYCLLYYDTNTWCYSRNCGDYNNCWCLPH